MNQTSVTYQQMVVRREIVIFITPRQVFINQFRYFNNDNNNNNNNNNNNYFWYPCVTSPGQVVTRFKCMLLSTCLLDAALIRSHPIREEVFGEFKRSLSIQNRREFQLQISGINFEPRQSLRNLPHIRWILFISLTIV